MSEGALALDEDEIRRGSGRLQHQLFGGSSDEVRNHGVDADAPPRDDDAGLSGGDELGRETGFRRRPQGLHPLFRELPARGGKPDQDGGRRELQRLFERLYNGRITPEVWQDVRY